MKKLLIILAFLPLISWGQKTAGYDFLYDGDIVVVGSDTTLEGDTDYILTFVDFDITLDYLPLKSTAKLNGQPLCTFFQNANYADTTFTLFAEHTLNADLTEDLPNRITEIWHYATPTVDVNDYAETPPKATVNFVDVTTTITAAVSAASSGDTIYIPTSDYPESIIISNKALTLIFIGNAKINPSTSYGIRYLGTVDYQRLENAQVYTTGSNLAIRAEAVVNNGMIFKNMYIDAQTGNAIYSSSDIVKELTFDNSYIKGVIQHSDKTVFNECFIDSVDNQIFKFFGGCDSVLFNYTHIGAGADAGLFDPLTNFSVTSFDSDFNSNLFVNSTVTFGVNFKANYCDFTSYAFLMNFTYIDSVTTYVSNSNFYNNTGSGFINLENQGDVSFIDCYFYDFDGAQLQVNGGLPAKNAVISGCTFITDSTQSIFITDYSTTFSDNYIESDQYSRLIVTAKEVDNIPATITNSTFISKGNIDEAGAFIELGTETDTDADGKLNGSIISGNLCIGPKEYGNISLAGHGIFKMAQSATIKHNEVRGRFLAYVDKNRGDNYTTVYFGNKSIECLTGFVIKGSPNTILYHNSVYSDTITTATTGINIVYDPNYVGSYSDSCIARNNILQLSGSNENNSCLRFKNDEDTVGFIASNNIYYTDGGADEIEIELLDYTFLEWQTLGYDVNSFNTDPLLSATLCPGSNSPANGSGVDVGQDSLIVCGATYPNPEKIAVFAPFDMGAIEIPAPPKTINSAVRVIGGGQWIFFNGVKNTKVGY